MGIEAKSFKTRVPTKVDVSTDRSVRGPLVWTGIATAVVALPSFFTNDLLAAMRIIAPPVAVTYLFASVGPMVVSCQFARPDRTGLLFDWVRLLPWLFAPWLIAPALMVVEMVTRPAHVFAYVHAEPYLVLYEVLASVAYVIWIVLWMRRGATVSAQRNLVVCLSALLTWCMTAATGANFLLFC